MNENMMSPPTHMIIPITVNLVTKVVDPTSTPSHYNRSSCYDRHTLPFLDVELKECIEHLSDKEE